MGILVGGNCGLPGVGCMFAHRLASLVLSGLWNVGLSCFPSPASVALVWWGGGAGLQLWFSVLFPLTVS